MQIFSTDGISPHEREHAALVRALAPECTLFLKTSGEFPVHPCRVRLYGNGARRTLKGGKGSGDVNTRTCTSVEEGLERAGFTVTTKPWLDAFEALRTAEIERRKALVAKEGEKYGAALNWAVLNNSRLAFEYDLPLEGEGDLSLYVLARDASEGVDRSAEGDYFLTESEKRDILALAKGGKFMLILNTCGPVDLTPVIGAVKDVLLLGFLGAETGAVFADLLTGKRFPSGKLTATWAKNLTDYPSVTFGDIPDTDYTEGIFVGYRYFSAFQVEPLFPFGFGLGYTRFCVEPFAFRTEKSAVLLDVLVRNTGRFSGKETVQIYGVREGSAPMSLIGFKKSKALAAGEEQRLTVRADLYDMAEYAEDLGGMALRAGRYLIYVGTSSRDLCCACAIDVASPVLMERAERLFPAPDFKELRASQSNQDVPILGRCVFAPTPLRRRRFRKGSAARAARMDDAELISLCIGRTPDSELSSDSSNTGAAGFSVIGNASKCVAGGAGETAHGKTYSALQLADGPAGLRLSPVYRRDSGMAVAAVDPLVSTKTGGLWHYERAETEGMYYQFCTAIPAGTALAQSFSPAVCKKMGALVAREMDLFGVDIWLAPALNIQRHPLCGRNFEYFSEDPFLSGVLAAAVVNGVQSVEGKVATVKHFCCNNQEDGRLYTSSNVGDRALREVYLKPFEVCLRRSRPRALMTSYNLVNGTHTANSDILVKKVLRGEWGYEGLVMTDWETTGTFGSGKKYACSSPRLCLAATVDLIMPGERRDVEDILEALKTGELKRQQLIACAGRILRLAKKS